uniref:CRP-I 25 n=1 Tax=Mytilus galloprovincialis TaxID=29158 RepID=A0A0A7ACV4_MYTGA|nr:CRP-I 25 [Mytilus galloprovincialis]
MKVSVCIVLCLLLAFAGTSTAKEETFGKRLLSRMRRAGYCSAVGVSCGSDLACCSKKCAYGKCY